jgi:diguanylate cyclase (GGDEF)-like protein
MSAEIERVQTAQREQEVRKRVEVLNVENTRLARKATTDPLTGVGNRAAFDDRIRRECTQGAKHGHAVGLLLLDLDRFKLLNDTHGHQAGDEALRRTGECLKSLCDETRFAARYGGEEFALLVTNQDPAALRRLAEQLRVRVQQMRIRHKDATLPVTASIGVSFAAPGHADMAPERLIEMADACLYAAKSGGRNRVVVHGDVAAAPAGV